MSQDPTHTIMRADYLLAAALFVSTEETRYYLNGIYTEPHQAGGAVCVATEGHGLGCVYDDEGYCHNPQGVWHTSAITALKNLMTAAKKHRPPAGNLYAELKHTEAKTDAFYAISMFFSRKHLIYRMKYPYVVYGMRVGATASQAPSLFR